MKFVEIICNVFLKCLIDISQSLVAQKSPWPCNFLKLIFSKEDYWSPTCRSYKWPGVIKGCSHIMPSAELPHICVNSADGIICRVCICSIFLSLDNWRYLVNLQTQLLHNCFSERWLQIKLPYNCILVFLLLLWTQFLFEGNFQHNYRLF